MKYFTNYSTIAFMYKNSYPLQMVHVWEDNFVSKNEKRVTKEANFFEKFYIFIC